jgi:FixJ family two-component response regulator
MPGETGLFLLAALVENYPDMAVIMVSGNEELGTAVYAMRQGADDFLSKPVGVSLLVYRIEKALSRRAILVENKAYRQHLDTWSAS